MSVASELTVRSCARAIADAMAEHEDDFPAFVEAAAPVCRRLMQRPDLLTLGFPIGTHDIPVRLIYTDEDLTIILGHEPKDVAVAVHDHGIWEMLGLYNGRLEHHLYEREDDGSVPGVAELREIDARTLERGDVVVVPPPPHDVHGFTPLADLTYLVAVLPGWYRDVRRYFDPAAGTYIERRHTPV
jgi:predicted metal-dependent enzyme (double-stranded beta helix superfamily)